MGKIFKIILLTVVILASFGYVGLYLLSTGSTDAVTGKHWRKNLSRYPVLRTALKLHYDGDATYDFLGKDKKRIVIEYDFMTGFTVRPNQLEMIRKQIETITGKPTSSIVSERDIEEDLQLTSFDLETIINNHKNEHLASDEALLYILFASTNAQSPTILGTTFKEWGVVVFMNSISDFTFRNPSTYDNYIHSTILHEFGHQVGLDHNNLQNCLMAEQIENAHLSVLKPEQVIINFCDSELNELERIRQSVN